MNTSLIESPNQKINNKTSKDPPRKKKLKNTKLTWTPKLQSENPKSFEKKNPTIWNRRRKNTAKPKAKISPRWVLPFFSQVARAGLFRLWEVFFFFLGGRIFYYSLIIKLVAENWTRVVWKERREMGYQNSWTRAWDEIRSVSRTWLVQLCSNRSIFDTWQYCWKIPLIFNLVDSGF